MMYPIALSVRFLPAVSACLLLAACGRAPQQAESAAAGEDLKVAILPKHDDFAASGDPIPAGTVIKVRPLSAISSRTVAAGESIVVTVAEPVVVNGETRVHEGAEAVVSVIESDPGAKAGSRPALVLRLREIRFGIVERSQLHTASVVLKGDPAPEIAGAGPVSTVPIAGIEIGTGMTLSFKLESTATVPRRRR